MNGFGHFDIHKSKSVLITGAGHGIGLSLVKNFIDKNEGIQVFATFRNESKAKELFKLKKNGAANLKIYELDAGDENAYEVLAGEIAAQVEQLDALVNCIGFLHDDTRMPEKRFQDLNSKQILDSFQVNSLPVALLAKRLFPLFKNSSPAAFVSLSARVGSISDNRSGGWYSYRASKCAQNMFMKNIALELERYKCNTLALSLHPGTTETELSRPFIQNTKYIVHSPDQAAANILDVISSKGMESNGGFFDWQGKPIEW